jgi:hypothetical protein
MAQMHQSGGFAPNVQPIYRMSDGRMTHWPPIVYANGQRFFVPANFVSGIQCPPIPGRPPSVDIRGWPVTQPGNGGAWVPLQPTTRVRKRQKASRKSALLILPSSRQDSSTPGPTLSSGPGQSDTNQASTTPKALSNIVGEQITVPPSSQDREGNGDDGNLSLFMYAGAIRVTLTDF